MATDELRIGLVGCGGMGMRLGRALNALDGAKISVCCDVDPKAAKAGAEELGQAETIDDCADVWARPDVDAVIIATPNHLHAPMAIAAAAAGKHIFTEKPMATNVKDCDAMIEAARKAGVKLMVGQVLRYIGQFSKAKNIIDSGELGRPFSIDIDRVNQMAFREGWRQSKEATGGMLCEVHVHELDFMAYILGEPISAYAQSGHFGNNPYDFDDELIGIYRFADGGIGSLHASFCSSMDRYNGKILCEKGAIFFGHVPGEALIRRGDAEPEDIDLSDVPNPHERELAQFVHSIRTDTEPAIPGWQGRRAIMMAQASYISAESGQVVKLPVD